MTDTTATLEQRAAAAQHAHTLAWRRQRLADHIGDPINGAFWGEIRTAALAELEDCLYALRAGAGAAAPLPDDGIQRNNADLPERSGHAYLR